jgi:hypothetical protein
MDSLWSRLHPLHGIDLEQRAYRDCQAARRNQVRWLFVASRPVHRLPAGAFDVERAGRRLEGGSPAGWEAGAT